MIDLIETRPATPTRPAPSPNRDEGCPSAPGGIITALGVVFGDLGTSPLYAMQGIVAQTGAHLGPQAALGILSLLIWTLLIVVSFKYCLVVMRADNQGEGGILALMSLVRVDDWRRGTYLGALMALFGAALIYGDGVITPAISVLSALEGVRTVTRGLEPFILPLGVAILIGLFSAQRFGTARIGKAFGPIMLCWFLTIAMLGGAAILRHPGVVAAIDPRYAIAFLEAHHATALLILGGVFLCCTGGEALYADMGHVGRRPTRMAWYAIVLPALLLSYAGQTALLMDGGVAGLNPFFELSPNWAHIPLVVLATLATIIASQAIITSAFSMTRQAIQLGWLPRIAIRQTSSEAYGQIYVPDVNWFMAVATVLVMLAFGSSARLGGAYGLAVSTTMLMTSLLLFRAMWKVWQWPLWCALPLTLVFVAIDLVFLSANMIKLFQGGFVPLVLSLLVLTIMLTWRIGVQHVDAGMSGAEEDLQDFLDRLKREKIPRTKGIGVFLTAPGDHVPSIIHDYVASFGALKETVIALSIATEEIPRVPAARRGEATAHPLGIWRVNLRYGFMQVPDLPIALKSLECFRDTVNLDDALYFASRDYVLRREKKPGMPRLATKLFAFLFRNGARTPDRFRLPPDRTIEIARQIAI